MSVRRGKKHGKRKNLTARLGAYMTEMGLSEPRRFSSTPQGKHKMSEVLTEFIAPYATAATTEERYRKLLSIAVIAWNASMFSAGERQRILDSVIDDAMPFGAEDMKLVIDELIRRKERYFSHIKRLILPYDLTMTRDGSHLSVASSV